MKKTIALLLGAILTSVAAVGMTACDNSEAENPVKPEEPQGCAHLHHDETTLICADCGEAVVHDYDENGVCTRCGKTTIFATSPIGGQAITQDCSEQGTIVSVTYETHDYAAEATEGRDDLTLTKKMNVYLPYGYTEEEQYNVLILMHGSGENEDFWFAQGDYDPDNTTTYLRGYGTQQVLDNMMQQGLAEKTIVVTPCYDTNGTGLEYFASELMNDIMPYIVETYSTYAASVSEEDMIAARDHMAYAGLSGGSALGFRAVWRLCAQYFAYIGNYSGGITDGSEQDIIEKFTTGEYKEYAIRYWYSGAGELDGVAIEKRQEPIFLEVYSAIDQLQSGSDLANDDNCDFIWCKGTGHTYACWLTCLYNSMLVFFQV